MAEAEAAAGGGAGDSTNKVVLPLPPREVALTVVSPGRSAMARPFASTVATLGSLLVQMTAAALLIPLTVTGTLDPAALPSPSRPEVPAPQQLNVPFDNTIQA